MNAEGGDRRTPPPWAGARLLLSFSFPGRTFSPCQPTPRAAPHGPKVQSELQHGRCGCFISPREPTARLGSRKNTKRDSAATEKKSAGLPRASLVLAECRGGRRVHRGCCVEAQRPALPGRMRVIAGLFSSVYFPQSTNIKNDAEAPRAETEQLSVRLHRGRWQKRQPALCHESACSNRQILRVRSSTQTYLTR